MRTAGSRLTVRSGVAGVLLLAVLWGIGLPLRAQSNISGKPGLLYIPTAELLDDGTFRIGYFYNPSHYDLRNNNPNAKSNTALRQQSQSIYYFHLAVLPRLEVNLNLFHINGYIPLKERGIGDRQFDIKYGILREKARRPSLAVVLSAPFGIDNSLVTYAVAATKHFSLSKEWETQLTLGIGSPYYFDRSDNRGNDYNIFANYKLHSKNQLPGPYLSGPFGGVKLQYRKAGGVMAEWDSQHLNLGAYATLFRHWTVQAGVINFDQVTVATSFQFGLQKSVKQLVKQTK
nr:YjbH domain-containing protein [uncultured Arsenicibacter sp.]